MNVSPCLLQEPYHPLTAERARHRVTVVYKSMAYAQLHVRLRALPMGLATWDSARRGSFLEEMENVCHESKNDSILLTEGPMRFNRACVMSFRLHDYEQLIVYYF